MNNPDGAIADNRQRLIEAATAAFMEEGYKASVDRIAARAGVAKQTLYNYFPSKDDLFTEVVHQASDTILVPLSSHPGDPRAALIDFGLAYRAKLLGDCGLRIFRALVAEFDRFPNLAKAFYAKGPARTAAGLAEFLATLMAERTISAADPTFAAKMLLGMLVGFDRTRRLCGEQDWNPDIEPEHVAPIVDCFLRAYAPRERTQP